MDANVSLNGSGQAGERWEIEQKSQTSCRQKPCGAEGKEATHRVKQRLWHALNCQYELPRKTLSCFPLPVSDVLASHQKSVDRWYKSFFCPSPLPFGGSTVLSLARGPAGNRTATGSLSAPQEWCLPTSPRGRLGWSMVQVTQIKLSNQGLYERPVNSLNVVWRKYWQQETWVKIAKLEVSKPLWLPWGTLWESEMKNKSRRCGRILSNPEARGPPMASGKFCQRGHWNAPQCGWHQLPPFFFPSNAS